MTTPILPRHVITWLQGLKLSQPLRNIRRDLADGCILAEILSKYLPKDVQLHAFERATSRQRKKANWKLLTKILKSYRFPIDSKLEDSIIDADEAAAFEILVVLHDFLIEQQDWQQEENRDEPSCSQSLHSEQYAAQHLFQESLPWSAGHVQPTMMPSWQQQQQQQQYGIWQHESCMPDLTAQGDPQSLYYENPHEQHVDADLSPCLEYDKQPRPIVWQPYTDTDFQPAAPRKYWKLGKLGRGPESEADKEKRLRKIHAKEFSEQIRQHNMYQMATESHKACPKHEFPRAQSKRDRALDFARQVSKPAVRQHPLELGLHDAAEREQQTPLQHLEQHYLANQQQVAAVFGS
ncbi:hypothetical protein WJX74_004012 [Apatococcus lobatus]|uniref:Calponin-homology (CH) domain-containing protein n=1 Tax=Apatococcus lobatus TaxID=904363 RepID=A0AAW1RHK7_9CHLO